MHAHRTEKLAFLRRHFDPRLEGRYFCFCIFSADFLCMRGLLLYVVTLIPRCHAHLRRDIPAIGKADHEEHYSNNQSFDDDVGVDGATNETNMTNMRKSSNTHEANRGPPFFRGDIRGDANFNDKNENGTRDTAGSRPEYYGSVVTCAGKTFLLTRLDLGMPFNKGWQTRVRDLGDFSQNVAELPSRVLRYNTLSHNVAG